MKRVVFGLIVLLAIIHHDWWWWDDSETLVLGFIPIGLAYHACISIAAACLWAMAVTYCWPEGVDEDNEQISTAPTSRGGHS
jgi:hypothetical protein